MQNWLKLKKLALGLLLLFAPSAFAEYRAYRFEVIDDTTGLKRVVTSTLDPIQYAGYYPITAKQSTHLLATWRCKRRSENFTPICQPPVKNPVPSQAAPAAI